MDGNVLVCDMGCLVMLFSCEILLLCCEVLMWICAILWCILFSYLDFHNAKQSGILHSVGWKLKDESKKSVRNFSFVRIEYLRTNRGMIQNMRFLGYWLRGRLVEAIGRADGAIGRFAIGRPPCGLWVMGYRREVRGERWEVGVTCFW